MSGKFIVFEGPDGSGKTSVIDGIRKKLEEKNIDFRIFREPGGTEISEKIREILLDNNNVNLKYTTEALLMAASRAQLVSEKIIPLLKEEVNVICDRFVISSLVYQGIGRNLGIKEVEIINNFATNGLKPDLTIFLDIDAEVAMERKKIAKKLDRFEKEDIDFHKKNYEGYKKIASLNENEIVRIDASENLNKVIEKSYEILQKKFGF
ncbi:MAG: dTMP kinase [Peptoniphilaceae bacterium]|nr:dTMP kinase [Peptoniphilaceae bacterium]MDD7383315.1 dTMP kinase [Peptoniphilaceae bacterium]MDY3738314.1 dTMP kinase [Peptoniphilaceae bacterium]